MSRKEYVLFDKETKAFVYGYQTNAIQRMLDFDYICKRVTPSISAIINPSRAGIHKAFWGSKEIILPMYKSISMAAKAYPEADVMVNFASHRSAFETTMEALAEKTIRTVAVIAEGVPERQSRIMSATARKLNKIVIGPATVGGMAAGAFRIGNTAGTIENIIASKLYRPGCVGFVSKSGGMLNEAFNIISRNSDGISGRAGRRRRVQDHPGPERRKDNQAAGCVGNGDLLTGPAGQRSVRPCRRQSRYS